MYILTGFMHTHSLPIPTACGGIGATIIMVGDGPRIMAGDGIVGIRPIGDSVGVAGMVATMPAGGDTIITTITTTTGVGIRPAAIGVEMPIGEMPIPPVVLWEHPSVPIQVLAHLVRRPDVRRSSMGGSRCVARLLRQDRCAEVRLLQAMQLVG